MDHKKNRLTEIRTAVACHDSQGPRIIFVDVECTEQQYLNGDHYDIARGWVMENHDVNGPFWVCDNRDPSCLYSLKWDWDSVPVIGDGAGEQIRVN